jgi:hypothetical protein
MTSGASRMAAPAFDPADVGPVRPALEGELSMPNASAVLR